MLARSAPQLRSSSSLPRCSAVTRRGAVVSCAGGAQYRATGRRKAAIASVELVPGSGQCEVNGRPGLEYFNMSTLYMNRVYQPLEVLGLQEEYDIVIKAEGGGISAQSDAAKLGVARAILKINETARTPLKQEGLLTRDAREVERKKAGLKGARRAPQFSKR